MVEKMDLIGIGLALIVIGAALVVSPWISAKIADLPFVETSVISIMAGTVIFLSLFVIIAGAVLTYMAVTGEGEKAK